MGLNQIQPRSLISRQLYSLLFLFQEFLGIFWEPLKGLIAFSVAKHPVWSETQEQIVTARGAGILGGHVRSPGPSWLCGQSVAWVRGLRLPGWGDRSKRPGASGLMGTTSRRGVPPGTPRVRNLQARRLGFLGASGFAVTQGCRELGRPVCAALSPR